MKLIVAGATGFLGREVVRQALAAPNVTSLVALARGAVEFTDEELLVGSNRDKLVHVIIKDYGEYPPNVVAHFAEADACIWTVAIKPTHISKYVWSEVVRVCQACTTQGFSAMLEATAPQRGNRISSPSDSRGTARQFRFVYVSGTVTESDRTKKPFFWPEYALMRGETETQVHALAAEYNTARPVSATACRFGYIASPSLAGTIVGSLIQGVTGWPTLTSVQAAQVCVDQAVNGFLEGKGTLMERDLACIWKRIEREQVKGRS